MSWIPNLFHNRGATVTDTHTENPPTLIVILFCPNGAEARYLVREGVNKIPPTIRAANFLISGQGAVTSTSEEVPGMGTLPGVQCYGHIVEWEEGVVRIQSTNAEPRHH